MRKQQLIKIESDEVQGPGSFVMIKPPKWGAIRTAMQLSNEDIAGYSDGFIAGTVESWNWTDDEGAPLLSPSQRPDVVEDLTFDEVRWLLKAIPTAAIAAANRGN